MFKCLKLHSNNTVLPQPTGKQKLKSTFNREAKVRPLHLIFLIPHSQHCPQPIQPSAVSVPSFINSVFCVWSSQIGHFTSNISWRLLVQLKKLWVKLLHCFTGSRGDFSSVRLDKYKLGGMMTASDEGNLLYFRRMFPSVYYMTLNSIPNCAILDTVNKILA